MVRKTVYDGSTPTKSSKADGALMLSIRRSLARLLNDLKGFDEIFLNRTGFYREKLAYYRKGGRLPSSVSLIALLAISEFPLEVTDPESGQVRVLTFKIKDQLVLPLGEPE